MGYKSDVVIVARNEDFISLIQSAKEKCQAAYETLSDAMGVSN